MHSWRTGNIGDVLTLQRGVDITKDEQRPGRIPVVSSGGIASYHDTPAAKGPGVVIGRKGTLGTTFWLTGDYWPHDTTLWVKDFRGNDPKFVYYFLRWHEDVFLALDNGTANPTLNRNHVHPLPAEWPEVSEQSAIADVLGALDDKIELNRQMNHTLEEMASALFERLMVTVDENPGLETTVQSLIDRKLLVVGDGYRAKNGELATAGLPFARAGTIDGGFQFADAELLGWPAVTRAGAKVSVPFDVVFTSKGTVGRFAFVAPGTPKFAYSPQLCFWRSVDHDALSPFFLYHWMRSSRFLEQVDAVKGQTDMADYVSLTDQRLMTIACPKAAEHSRFRDEVSALWDLHFANTDESKTLTALRDALLPKLLSGEVRLNRAEKAVEAAF